MSQPPDDPAAFRAAATKTFRFTIGCLVFSVIAVSGLGWYFGGWLWLVIGAGVALVIAAVVAVAVSFIYAMSQDGG